MKKIPSGQGATDFGQATGLTQDELFGRTDPKKVEENTVHEPQKVLDNLAPGVSIPDRKPTAIPIGEPMTVVQHFYEPFTAHAETLNEKHRREVVEANAGFDEGWPPPPPDWHNDESVSLPTSTTIGDILHPIPQSTIISAAELQKKIKDIIYAHWQNAGTGFPHWIDSAAEAIVGHIG